MIIFEGSRRVL